MSERKPQTKYVPLRVRFRSQGESQAEAPEQMHIIKENFQGGAEPLVPDLSDFSDAQRRTQQIKELVRLSTLLRADLGLDMILQQFAASIAACTGFRVLVINLFDEKHNCVQRAAFAGLSEADQLKLRSKHLPADGFPRGLSADFRISQSYFVPHEYGEVLCSAPVMISHLYEDYEPGGWHAEDLLVVPFYSPREQKMLGYLSLDDPEDGKRPTEESIEVAELFANQVAIAVDNAHLLQERENEHRALEQGIACLKENLEVLRNGHLRPLDRATHPALQSMVDAINSVTREVIVLLGSMRLVSHAIDEHDHNVEQSADLLARQVNQDRPGEVSQILNELTTKIRIVSEYVAALSVKLDEAQEVTEGAQLAVDRAVEGMQDVRDATLHSARMMKALGESCQEVNEAVSEITDLSMRLHLLSLNAAIEASRAGEHGQGFAVVVKEMRLLAQGCTQAAHKVSDYIRTFQQETSMVSHSVEQSTQRVIMQTELVTQTGVTLQAVSKVTEDLVELVQRICATVDSQEQGARLAEQALSEIRRVADVVTLHTQGIRQSLCHLVELTETLRSRMAAFNIDEHQVATR